VYLNGNVYDPLGVGSKASVVSMVRFLDLVKIEDSILLLNMTRPFKVGLTNLKLEKYPGNHMSEKSLSFFSMGYREIILN